MSSAANQIMALLILDADSNRLAVRYCPSGLKHWNTVDEQRKFERKVINKLPKPTGRPTTDGDVAMIGDQLVLYKICNDVYVCVVCSTNENELIICQVLDGVFSAISQLTQASFVSNGLTKQGVLEKLDQVLLVLDESTDDGIIMEVDEDKIVNRVQMLEETSGEGGVPGAPGAQDSSASNAQAVFNQATNAAKKRMLDSLWGSRS